MGSIGKGGELELELVNGGPVLELGLAIAQRTSGEGEEGRQWQGAREGRQGARQRLGQGRRQKLGSALLEEEERGERACERFREQVSWLVCGDFRE